VTLVDPADKFGKVWREDIADDRSATGDIVLDGDTVYASSNFTVAAVDGKGKRIWDAEGKDGALIKTIDVQKDIVDMAVWGGRLVLATSDGLKILTLD
jgi:hypothetical protein